MSRFRLLVIGLVMMSGACVGSPQPIGSVPEGVDQGTSADSFAPVSEVASPSDAGTRPTSAPETRPQRPGTTTSGVDAPVQLAYETVLEGLAQPIVLTARAGDDVSYLATKSGVIFRLVNGELSEPVLDISTQIENSGERGFLGLALHPTDLNRLFVHYSAVGTGSTVVSEYGLDEQGLSHPESEQVLLTVEQPASNHNGGMIQFGPDTALYLGLGDGGGGGDTFGNGQNPDTLLGSLIRIDVDTGDVTSFAIGLRNPWRFWIDGELIYIGDVGQNAFEEIDVAPLSQGANYGWPITEALHCFSPSFGCETDGLTLPVVEVEHGDAGTCSITGGVVYHGSDLPTLDGHYFYSDFCGGWLRSFVFDGSAAVERRDWTEEVGVPGQVLSLGVDGAGEMYVLTSDSVLRITDAG